MRTKGLVKLGDYHQLIKNEQKIDDDPNLIQFEDQKAKITYLLQILSNFFTTYLSE